MDEFAEDCKGENGETGPVSLDQKYKKGLTLAYRSQLAFSAPGLPRDPTRHVTPVIVVSYSESTVQCRRFVADDKQIEENRHPTGVDEQLQ